MHSVRFQRPVIVTRHAEQRMAERGISETMLLEMIDEGETRYADETHLWAFKTFPERHDNLGFGAGIGGGGQDGNAPFRGE